MRKVKYSFEACIGISNGYGNDYSDTVIELDADFMPVNLYTFFLGNNAVEEGECSTEPMGLTPEQRNRLDAAIAGFKSGLAIGTGKYIFGTSGTHLHED